MSEKKYCNYMQQYVVKSSFNNDGQCSCLKCKKQDCTHECSSVEHRADIPGFPIRQFSDACCWCNECINATLANEQQR